MARAVRFDHYGGREVLYIADVEVPSPAAGEVVVEVRAAGINPGEAAIRAGALDRLFPATFPSGEGSDLAGVVSSVGDAASGFAVGDEVLGWSWRRSSHAEYVAVPITQLTHKPTQLSWEVAGSLYVVACTAYAAGAGGRCHRRRHRRRLGVRRRGRNRRRAAVAAARCDRHRHRLRAQPRVAPKPRHHPARLRERARRAYRSAAPNGLDAFIDLFGPEYVQLAVDLGVAPDRIDTIISREKAVEVGAKVEGSGDASTTAVLAEMAELVASGQIEIPIAATYPLERVRDAFAELEERHTHGKIVLIP